MQASVPLSLLSHANKMIVKSFYFGIVFRSREGCHVKDAADISPPPNTLRFFCLLPLSLLTGATPTSGSDFLAIRVPSQATLPILWQKLPVLFQEHF